nr:4512_t:CDS:2 [Entrophospora candida]
MKMKSNQKKALDSIKKDIQKLVVSSNYDDACRNKAQEIINQWKDWSITPGDNLKCSKTIENIHLAESSPKISPQVSQHLTELMSTPNKYSQDISLICAYGKTILELTLEIGKELTKELSSIHDINPAIWTPGLEVYIDTVLKESGYNFKTAVQNKVPDKLFQLYCKKVLLDL